MRTYKFKDVTYFDNGQIVDPKDYFEHSYNDEEYYISISPRELILDYLEETIEDEIYYRGKYEPFRESRKEYITRKYGDMWSLKRFEYHRRNSTNCPNVLAHRIVKNNIGKSYDLALKYFCKQFKAKKIKSKYFPTFIFKDEFGRNYYSPYYDYSIDSNGLIQAPKSRNKKLYSIPSDDFKMELCHKVTGHSFDDFSELWSMKTLTHTWFNSITKQQITKEYQDRDKFLYYEYTPKGKMQPNNIRYTAQNSDFEKRITQGSIQYFESKKDPRFVKYFAEKKKQLKRNKPKKHVFDEVEFRRLLKAKELADKLEAKQKLEAKGMRPNAFTNHI